MYRGGKCELRKRKAEIAKWMRVAVNDGQPPEMALATAMGIVRGSIWLECTRAGQRAYRRLRVFVAKQRQSRESAK